MSKGAILTKSKDFAVRIIKLTRYLQDDKHEYVLSKQIMRSGTSIGANARESNNAQSLADAIDWALKLPAKEKEKISKAAIKNVKDNFTKQIMCDKTIAVYQELMKK